MMLCLGLALAQELPPVLPEMSVEQSESVWPARVVLGADALNMDVDFVGKAYTGTQLVYGRDYKGAQDAWFALDDEYPGLGVKHVGSVLIYQSIMMENWDFKNEDQYNYHSAEAIRVLEKGLETPGNEAWEHFMLAGMQGIESINIFRKDEFVGAVGKGLDALGHIQHVKDVAPDFADIYLCDGLYKYWRSVVARSSKAIPDGVDERPAGIADMKKAEGSAVFLGPGSSIGLTYSYIEEDKYKTALTYTSKIQKSHPNSVINHLLHARVQVYLKRYDPSLKTLNRVKAVAPKNERMYYYYSTAFMKKGALDNADGAIDTYLGFGLLPYYEAQSWHRKGDIAFRRKDYDSAEKHYKKAVQISGYKPAKARLAKIKTMRKEGKI
jgi:tetratricopeptide (TPR) repeat protein